MGQGSAVEQLFFQDQGPLHPTLNCAEGVPKSHLAWARGGRAGTVAVAAVAAAVAAAGDWLCSHAPAVNSS